MDPGVAVTVALATALARAVAVVMVGASTALGLLEVGKVDVLVVMASWVESSGSMCQCG